MLMILGGLFRRSGCDVACADVYDFFFHFVLLLFQGGGDEGTEERMGFEGLALELGMELAA